MYDIRVIRNILYSVVTYMWFYKININPVQYIMLYLDKNTNLL